MENLAVSGARAKSACSIRDSRACAGACPKESLEGCGAQPSVILASGEWRTERRQRKLNWSSALKNSSVVGLPELETPLPQEVTDVLLGQFNTKRIVLYGENHDYELDTYVLASLLPALKGKWVLAVEKKLSVQRDLDRFMLDGSIAHALSRSLNNAPPIIELLRAARTVDMQVVAFDNRERPTWREDGRNDEEMFDFLRSRVLDVSNTEQAILFTGRSHVRDLDDHRYSTVYHEDGEYVEHKCKGPTIGHFARRCYTDSSLLVQARSNELPWEALEVADVSVVRDRECKEVDLTVRIECEREGE